LLLEQCTVSRKTPLDGKLEISPGAAQRLTSLGTDLSLPLTAPGGDGVARLTSIECTCQKAAGGGRHVHHFIESSSFRALTPGTTVRLELDAAGSRLHVAAGS
jgi:hypothetical protein